MHCLKSFEKHSIDAKQRINTEKLKFIFKHMQSEVMHHRRQMNRRNSCRDVVVLRPVHVLDGVRCDSRLPFRSPWVETSHYKVHKVVIGANSIGSDLVAMRPCFIPVVSSCHYKPTMMVMMF